MDNIQLGDVAAWAAAVGTVGALFLALFQIGTERKARLARDRRSQAVHVSAWPDVSRELPEDLILANNSEEPVYEVVVSLVLVQGAGQRTGEHPAVGNVPRMILPPGRWRMLAPRGWAGMFAMPGVEIAFTDAAGAHWIRRATGGLEEIAKDPFRYYDVAQPVEHWALTPDVG